ncbi:MAG: ion transporter [Deltaproteobacteria bacterium]|nr:ion transporter [Deltaproteobacteria bacterium]MCB9478508.1 ion transporter [Deltaproteobacteria bacterium]
MSKNSPDLYRVYRTEAENRPSDSAADWRLRLHTIIFEAETPAGKFFDVALLVAIVASVAAVLLESVESIRVHHGTALLRVEWFFTVAFTIEYALRLISVRRPSKYALSFFGLVDLLAILPTYASLVFVDAHSLLVIRVLRMLRVFRVFKLARFLGEADILVRALRASRAKVTVFIMGVMTVVVIIGAAMYLIEGPENGFTSIPRGIYWAIVTMTTVGYGDIAPQTVPGQVLASLVMLLGYGVLAVPTGIVSVEIAQASRNADKVSTTACPECSYEGHDADAKYCKYCGAVL